MAKYDRLSSEDFARLLAEVIDADNANASDLLGIPGVYEVLSEHYNNEELSAWDDEQEELAADEPADEDITTADYQHFYYCGRQIVVVGPDDDWMPAVGAWCKAQQYFPNVWAISDHGNSCLISVGTDGRYLNGHSE